MGSFKVIFFTQVIKIDLPKLDVSAQKMIKKAINERLTTQPMKYGEPLFDDWKHHRRLRVSKYRIIYKIESDVVIIKAIGIRSKIYKEK